MLFNAFLIKNKRNAVITCQLIFMLSVSDSKSGLFSQYVSIAKAVFTYFHFLVHSSIYTIAAIGIDLYIKIKHYGHFRALQTTRVVIFLILMEFFVTLCLTARIAITFLSRRESNGLPNYIAIASLIFKEVILLQVSTT